MNLEIKSQFHFLSNVKSLTHFGDANFLQRALGFMLVNLKGRR